MDVTKEYTEILHHLESVLFTFYVADPNFTDVQTLQILGTSIRYFNSLRKNRKLPVRQLSQDLVERADLFHGFCLAYCGYADEEAAANRQLSEGEHVSPEVMHACVRRIEKSVHMWHKQGGQRGYHAYMTPFMGAE